MVTMGTAPIKVLHIIIIILLDSDHRVYRVLLQATRLVDPMLVLQDYVEDMDNVPNHFGFDFKLLPTSDATVRVHQQFNSLCDLYVGCLVCFLFF